MRPDEVTNVPNQDAKASARDTLVISDADTSILIELKAVPRSVSEVQKAAGAVLEQLKYRSEFADYTEAHFALLYQAIENALFEAWEKHRPPSRAMRRAEQELSKIRRTLHQLGEQHYGSGAG